MFKKLVVLVLMTLLTLFMAACGEKSTPEKITVAAEAMKQDVVDATHDASDTVVEAANDVKSAAKKTIE